MGLADIVRSGVAIAASLVDDILVSVTIEARTGEDEYRKPAYAAGVPYDALVEDDVRLVKTDDRGEVLTRSKLSFLQNATVAVRDRVTLPDGSKGLVVDVKGLADPAGGRYLVEAWIGEPA